MNFEHTEDRRMLADTLQRMLAAQYPIAQRNACAYGADGRSPALYAQLAELGAVGALFPESVGGLGGSGFDISVVFEALGAALVTEPLLGALVLGQAIRIAGTAEQQALLASLIDGSVTATWAHDEVGGHGSWQHVATTASPTPEGGWVLQGAKSVVLFGDTADHILVSARTAGAVDEAQGISLFVLPGTAAGLQRKGMGRIDGGRVAELTLEQVTVPADALLGTAGQGHAVLAQVLDYALLALSAEAVGALDAAKDQTLEYLRSRQQFGVPIGSFQALQHRMADVLLEVEQARSAVINAADAIDHATGAERARVLAAAKYTVGRVGGKVAEECIQLHGGMGMTWELPLSHYAKRLVMLDHQCGDQDVHLERYMALMEVPDTVPAMSANQSSQRP